MDTMFLLGHYDMLLKASLSPEHRYIAANFLLPIFFMFGSQVLHNTYFYPTDFTTAVCLNRNLDQL